MAMVDFQSRPRAFSVGIPSTEIQSVRKELVAEILPLSYSCCYTIYHVHPRVETGGIFEPFIFFWEKTTLNGRKLIAKNGGESVSSLTTGSWARMLLAGFFAGVAVTRQFWRSSTCRQPTTIRQTLPSSS
jgi:hypothetical protein